jgi:hypothetical protein
MESDAVIALNYRHALPEISHSEWVAFFIAIILVDAVIPPR